jgi:hypothetical protein
VILIGQLNLWFKMCLTLIGIYIYKREMWSIMIGQLLTLDNLENTPPKLRHVWAVCQKNPGFFS